MKIEQHLTEYLEDVKTDLLKRFTTPDGEGSPWSEYRRKDGFDLVSKDGTSHVQITLDICRTKPA